MKQKRERSKGVLTPLIFIVLAIAVTLCGIGIGTASAATTVEISPSSKTINNSDYVTLYINVTPDEPIRGVQCDLSFDQSLVTVNSVTEGNLLDQGGANTMFGVTKINNTIGSVDDVYCIITSGSPVSSSGTFAIINLTADAANEGITDILLSNVQVRNATNVIVPTSTVNGSITVGVPTEPTVVVITPSSKIVGNSATFTLNITVNPIEPLRGVQCDLSFDQSLVTVNSVTEGNLLDQGGANTMFGVTKINNTIGSVDDVYCIITSGSPVSSSGTFAIINLTADAANTGTTDILLSNVQVRNATNVIVPTSTVNGSVTVEVAPAVKAVINEFVAKPNVTETSEWIELYNNATTEVNLTGWTIEDNTATPKSLTGKTVPANGYLVLNKSAGDFTFALNDPGDIIILKNGTTEVDRVAYGNFDDGNTADNAPAPDEDNSTGRDPNGVDTDNDANDFTEFGTPTPGAENGLPKDGNIDGIDGVNMQDAIYLVKHIYNIPGYEDLYADGNIDSEDGVNMQDAIYLVKHIYNIPGYEVLYP